MVLCSASAADWWENGNFYQIYPRSFKDSNADGIGDLKGIMSKLPYLQDLGVTGIWLSPIFKSPMHDAGYDISDFKDIQPEYGTLTDFDYLAESCKDHNIKLILDFVPNHTSDEHEWFIKSAARESGYEDFYIWHPGTTNVTTGAKDPPNNWLSVFRFSGWKWNEQRQEYYLHQFVTEQPDLNYRNAKVVEEMKDVLRFWLARGVSGFRIDAVPHLFEIGSDASGNYPDEPPSGLCNDPQSHCYLNHIYTQNQPETFDMVYQWRAVMDQFKVDNGGESRILMTEAYTTLENLMLFYGNGVRNGSHIPFNFQLLQGVNANTKGSEIKRLIDLWLNSMPKDAQVHANWVLGNHDNHRLSSRLGRDRIDLFNIMLKTLPGIAVTYNGEEIGMTNVHVSWADTLDPQACNTNSTVYHENSRDPARTPMQWDQTLFSGFSTTTGKTWLPVSPNYKTVNVASQELSPRSHLKVFKRLIQLRNEPSMITGTYEPILIGDDILIYKRQAQGNNPYVIVLNFGTTAQTVNLKSLFSVLPDRIQVVTSSILSQYIEGAVVNSNTINIRGEHGVVFTI